MNKQFIKELTNFNKQMKICAVLCWCFTIFILVKFPDKLVDFFIVPICAIVYTIIFIKTYSNLKEYKKHL